MNKDSEKPNESKKERRRKRQRENSSKTDDETTDATCMEGQYGDQAPHDEEKAYSGTLSRRNFVRLRAT